MNSPTTSPPESPWLDRLWFLAFAGAATWYGLIAARALGPTFDEPFYLSAGMERWRTGSYEKLLRAGTMPLPVDVETLPVYLWETWRGQPFDVEADMDTILPVARAGMLVFVWLLLWYGRLLGRQWAGPWGGRLAVALLAIEPSFLGHGSLATTDVAIAACLLPLVYHFGKNRAGHWFYRRLLPGLWLGIAILAKASALMFGPVCLGMLELHRLHQEGKIPALREVGFWRWLGGTWSALRPFWRDFWAIFGIALLTAFIYCGSDWQPLPSFVRWADGLEDGAFKSVMVWLANNLAIFPNAGMGLVRQVRHNLQGHLVYLAGVESGKALWYYFPLLLIIKLSLPLLAMFLAALCTRPRSLVNGPFLCFLALMGLSFTFRVQIGIRMVLPVVALGMIGLAIALVQTWEAWGPALKRRMLAAGVAACVLWTAATTWMLAPHGLCFTNELWGRTEKGYYFVSDANYDWGQGLKELRQWQQTRGVDNLDVWYFGTDPQVERLPLRNLILTHGKVKDEAHFRRLVSGRYLAVSTTLLYGSYAPGAEAPRRVLRDLTPVERTQTFLIYDFRD